jgi:hypothetical protein
MGLAIVVGSPDLLDVAPHGPDEMRKANALCRLVEIADAQLAKDPERSREVLTLGL